MHRSHLCSSLPYKWHQDESNIYVVSQLWCSALPFTLLPQNASTFHASESRVSKYIFPARMAFLEHLLQELSPGSGLEQVSGTSKHASASMYSLGSMGNQILALLNKAQ